MKFDKIMQNLADFAALGEYGGSYIQGLEYAYDEFKGVITAPKPHIINRMSQAWKDGYYDFDSASVWTTPSGKEVICLKDLLGIAECWDLSTRGFYRNA